MSTVSVLIGTYNRANFIQEALESVLNQTYPPAQVLVVDDGSEDDTAKRVSQYGSKVTYLRKENGGRASAINYGMSHLHGEYVWIFDDDDIALPGALCAWIKVLQRRADLGFVYSPHLLGQADGSGRIVSTRSFRAESVPEDQGFLTVMKKYCFAMQAILVRRSCYQQAGPFDEGLLRSADYEMMIRLAYLFPFAVVSEPAFVLRQHQGPRGPKALRHSGSVRDRTHVHMEYDGKIGRIVRKRTRLEEYVHGPKTEKRLSPSEHRLALLTRMSVMASKGLLTEMLDDLEAACSLSGEPGADMRRTLGAKEVEACEEAMHYPYFWLQFLNDASAFIERSKRVAASRTGRQAIYCFAKGMFMHAKSYGEPIRERFRRLRYVFLFGKVWLSGFWIAWQSAADRDGRVS